MKKHLQATAGALQRYCNNATFVLHCRTVTALAFVPPNRINEALQTLENQLPQEIEFLIHWVEDYCGSKWYVSLIWSSYPKTINFMNYPLLNICVVSKLFRYGKIFLWLGQGSCQRIVGRPLGFGDRGTYCTSVLTIKALSEVI